MQLEIFFQNVLSHFMENCFRKNSSLTACVGLLRRVKRLGGVRKCKFFREVYFWQSERINVDELWRFHLKSESLVKKTPFQKELSQPHEMFQINTLSSMFIKLSKNEDQRILYGFIQETECVDPSPVSWRRNKDSQRRIYLPKGLNKILKSQKWSKLCRKNYSK